MKELVNLIKTSFKLIGIIILVIVCIIAGVIFWNFYQEEKITMIALECKWEETSTGLKNHTEWYLIKKERKSQKPFGLYRGTHLKAIPGNEDIFLQNELTDYNSKVYYFGVHENERKGEWGHAVNRKTLKIWFYSEDEKWNSAPCKEISEKDFYLSIKDRIKEKKKSVKF